jgi:hypothetical protein
LTGCFGLNIQGDSTSVSQTRPTDLMLFKFPRTAEEVPTFSKDEWISILSLAQRWNFRDIKELAINSTPFLSSSFI